MKIEATKNEMIQSAAKAGVRIISQKLRGKETVVDLDEYDRRMAICEKCPMFTESKRCAKCGCFMSLKAKFRQARCPLDKWNEK